MLKRAHLAEQESLGFNLQVALVSAPHLYQVGEEWSIQGTNRRRVRDDT